MEKESRFTTWNAIFFALLIGSFVVVFWPTIASLVYAWEGGDDNSHGFIIFPVSAYLVWIRREALASVPCRSSAWGMIPVVIALLLYVISRYGGILTLAPFAMVMFVHGLVLFLFGIGLYSELMFPLWFLFLMIPVPSQLYAAMTIPLQLLVTKFSVAVVDFLGVTVLREGNVIHLPEKSFQVVRACSGLRSLVALFTLNLVVGYMTLRSLSGRTALLIAGLPVAILVNILRVVVMVLAFQYYRYDLTDDSIHTLFGMVIFGIALLMVTLMQRMVSHWETSPAPESP